MRPQFLILHLKVGTSSAYKLKIGLLTSKKRSTEVTITASTLGWKTPFESSTLSRFNLSLKTVFNLGISKLLQHCKL